jgi:hypothetical protein
LLKKYVNDEEKTTPELKVMVALRVTQRRLMSLGDYLES